MNVQFFDQSNKIHWKLSTNGIFSVKSMYMDLIDFGPLSRSLHMWKIKISLRIKIFIWFVHKRVVLTKDNLIKRRRVGCSKCCYCDQNKTIRHLFLDCSIAKLLWHTLHIAFNITPSTNINMLFRTWLSGVNGTMAYHIWIGICALLWAYGTLEMTWFLMTRPLIIFCRLYIRPRLESVRGRYSTMRTRGSLWLLDATDERRAHGLS